jgi:micrococcal nuclease
LYEYRAKLIRVIDADSIVLDIDLGFYEWRLGQSYRLLRINAPELNTEEGKVARVALEKFLAGKNIIAQTQKSDSFGRFLVELYADSQNCSDWLVSNGFAVYKVY